jgi:hypothetical protein
MGRGPSPVLGYNTNVRHKGKTYHLQTEDSGVNHPHIITHLFADGGRVVASRKITYAEYLGAADLQQVVKRLMQDQHKAMFIALKDGQYDEEEDALSGAPTPQAVVRSPRGAPTPVEPIDIEALERAAAQFTQGSAATTTAAATAPGKESAGPAAGRYQVTRPARTSDRAKAPAPRAVAATAESIFGSELLSEKSLDEVILAYLAEDLEETDG